MSNPARQAVRSISIREVTDAIGQAPEFWPIAQKALLDFLDAVIAKSPVDLRSGLQTIRDQIATATTVPASLVADLMHALKSAVLSGDFGPATSDQADLG